MGDGRVRRRVPELRRGGSRLPPQLREPRGDGWRLRAQPPELRQEGKEPRLYLSRRVVTPIGRPGRASPRAADLTH